MEIFTTLFSLVCILGLISFLSMLKRHTVEYQQRYNRMTPEQQAQHHREVFSTPTTRVRRRRRRRYVTTRSNSTSNGGWGGLGGMMK